MRNGQKGNKMKGKDADLILKKGLEDFEEVLNVNGCTFMHIPSGLWVSPELEY